MPTAQQGLEVGWALVTTRTRFSPTGLGPLAPWSRAGGRAWVLPDPHRVPSPQKAARSHQQQAAHLPGKIPAQTETAVQRPTHAQDQMLCHVAQDLSCRGRRASISPFSPAPPCTCLQGSTPPTTLCCRRLPVSVCPHRPLFRPILPLSPCPGSLSLCPLCVFLRLSRGPVPGLVPSPSLYHPRSSPLWPICWGEGGRCTF